MDEQQSGPFEQMGANPDFDFDQSTAQAWEVFRGRLADVVSMIEDGAALTIGTDPVDLDDVTHGHLVLAAATAHDRVHA